MGKYPTKEQLEIIEYDNNIVVTAKPCSGKTFTIVEKIKDICDNILDYQGVIAISFTNKASDELKKRLDTQVQLQNCLSLVLLINSILAKSLNHSLSI